jgi:outer membrane receptor protein involved in Fe transport
VEFEGSFNYGHFSLSGGATYTHSRIVSDAITPAAVGNAPQRQANWVYQFSPSYSWHALNVGATVMGTTKSYASNPNGLVMLGYTQVNTYVSYDINDRMTASLSVNNLFNAIGLTEIDASPETVTANGVNTARSILGRTIYLNWQYHL